MADTWEFIHVGTLVYSIGLRVAMIQKFPQINNVQALICDRVYYRPNNYTFLLEVLDKRLCTHNIRTFLKHSSRVETQWAQWHVVPPKHSENHTLDLL